MLLKGIIAYNIMYLLNYISGRCKAKILWSHWFSFFQCMQQFLHVVSLCINYMQIMYTITALLLNLQNIYGIIILVGDEKSDERQLHARIITKLKGKYVSVVRKIRLIIEERNYKIEQLILDLCATDDDKQTIFSTDEAFVKITNLTQLFLWIEKYCSMYDYELLLALVESTECNEAIKLLDDFSEELQSSILKDLDLLSQEGELRDMKSFMAGTCKLEIKYVGGKCTLTTKENVQRIIRECFHLKKGSIIFRGAQEGCVTLIYQISPTVKSYLLQYQISSEDAIKLTSIKIKCLIIDGTEFFISSQPKEVSCPTISSLPCTI